MFMCFLQFNLSVLTLMQVNYSVVSCVALLFKILVHLVILVVKHFKILVKCTVVLCLVSLKGTLF